MADALAGPSQHYKEAMTEQYDPQGRYDVIDPEGMKVGELRQGRYFEST